MRSSILTPPVTLSLKGEVFLFLILDETFSFKKLIRFIREKNEIINWLVYIKNCVFISNIKTLKATLSDSKLVKHIISFLFYVEYAS